MKTLHFRHEVRNWTLVYWTISRVWCFARVTSTTSAAAALSLFVSLSLTRARARASS